MWYVLAEFRSISSEGSWREKRNKDIIGVKHKAEAHSYYVRWPKITEDTGLYLGGNRFI